MLHNMNGIMNFEQNIKEYLFKERNIDVNEETIWIIIQLYKKKKIITGKKKKKNKIISSFCTFINNREREGNENKIQEQKNWRGEDWENLVLRTAEINNVLPTIAKTINMEERSYNELKIKKNKGKTQEKENQRVREKKAVQNNNNNNIVKLEDMDIDKTEDMDINKFIDTYMLHEDNAPNINKNMGDLENGVVSMDIDRDCISEKEKFIQQNGNVSQNIEPKVIQMEIDQSFTPVTSQNTQDQVMKEQQYEYDRIGCLINVDDQVAHLGTQLASVTLYNKEEYEVEDSNRFLRDLTSLNSFYKNPLNNEDEEKKLNPSTENDEWYSDCSNSSSNSTLNINNKLRKKGNKKFTTYQRQLKVLKNKREVTTRESVDDSMHAKPSKPLLTYDAYIPVHKINRGSDVDEKRAYIELEFFDKKGYIGAELVKQDEMLQVIIKFDHIINLQMACKAFNGDFPDCKAEIKKYYRIGHERYSSKDFKIINVPKSITSETILEALHIVTKRKDFIIRNRNLANDVYFYTSDHYALNILKETWSIIIENEFYRVTPAFFKKENIEQRNLWVGKFKGLSREDNKHEIKNIFEHMGGMNFYWRDKTEFNTDNNIYIEFKRESDLISATYRNIQYKNFKIRGIRRGEMWPVAIHKANNQQEMTTDQNINSTDTLKQSQIKEHLNVNNVQTVNIPSINAQIIGSWLNNNDKTSHPVRHKTSNNERRLQSISLRSNVRKGKQIVDHQTENTVATGANNIPITNPRVLSSSNKDTTTSSSNTGTMSKVFEEIEC